jgi:hypothetical protein
MAKAVGQLVPSSLNANVRVGRSSGSRINPPERAFPVFTSGLGRLYNKKALFHESPITAVGPPPIYTEFPVGP